MTIFLDLEDEAEHLPEVKLWINVAERAIIDFTQFYSWYIARSADCGKVKPRSRTTLYYNMADALNELEWFLFCPIPQEHNLAWIFEHVGWNDTDNIKLIRNELRARHHTNYLENKDHQVLAPHRCWFESRIKRSQKRPQSYLKKVRWRVEYH